MECFQRFILQYWILFPCDCFADPNLFKSDLTLHLTTHFPCDFTEKINMNLITFQSWNCSAEVCQIFMITCFSCLSS